MKTLRKAAAPAAALFVGSVLIACGGSDGTPGANQTATAEQGTKTQSQSSHPDPIATLQVANNHVVEVYDFENRALVMESAEGETVPVLKEHADLIRSGHVADLFAKIRPDLPVPAALREAEARFVASAASAPAEEFPQLPNVLPSAGPSTQSGGASSAAGKYVPLDCGNICCNDNYLRTQLCSYDLAQPPNLHWYNYDYGWSTEWATNFFHWDGTVCSAGGTSLFSVSIDGGNIWWPVNEGYWLNYWWTNCGNCGRVNGTSFVNSQSNQHLHSFCGSIY